MSLRYVRSVYVFFLYYKQLRSDLGRIQTMLGMPTTSARFRLIIFYNLYAM